MAVFCVQACASPVSSAKAGATARTTTGSSVKRQRGVMVGQCPHMGNKKGDLGAVGRSPSIRLCHVRVGYHHFQGFAVAGGEDEAARRLKLRGPTPIRSENGDAHRVGKSQNNLRQGLIVAAQVKSRGQGNVIVPANLCRSRGIAREVDGDSRIEGRNRRRYGIGNCPVVSTCGVGGTNGNSS